MIAQVRQLLGRKFIQDTLALQLGRVGMIVLTAITSVVVFRRIGPQLSGEFALAESFLVIWQSLDLTGVGTSTGVRLPIAIGARDEAAILDLMAFYVKISLMINVGVTALIVVLGTPVAGLLYNGQTRIVVLAIWLSVASVADGIYGLVTLALQSRRSMRSLALMQNANQLVLTICLIAAVIVSPTPEGLVVGRVIYSYVTLGMALLIYARLRAQGQVRYPPMGVVFARARSVSANPYWRFGVANAIDKNIAALYTQLPIQLVGIFAGARAVGYLTLALSGIGQASVFTSSVFDNLQAVVPQAVGRKDFAGLWHNFRRVLVVMALGSVVFFGAVVVAAPILIPPIFGARWIPAIPALALLALYGATLTVGRLFAPLYRAFNLMGQIIAAKLIALALTLPLGLIALMAVSAGWMSSFVGTSVLQPYAASGSGALIGAGMVDGVYVISVALTAAACLIELRKRIA